MLDLVPEIQRYLEIKRITRSADEDADNCVDFVFINRNYLGDDLIV